MTSYKKASWMLKRLEAYPTKHTEILSLLNKIKIRKMNGKKMTSHQAKLIEEMYNRLIKNSGE